MSAFTLTNRSAMAPGNEAGGLGGLSGVAGLPSIEMALQQLTGLTPQLSGLPQQSMTLQDALGTLGQAGNFPSMRDVPSIRPEMSDGIPPSFGLQGPQASRPIFGLEGQLTPAPSLGNFQPPANAPIGGVSTGGLGLNSAAAYEAANPLIAALINPIEDRYPVNLAPTGGGVQNRNFAKVAAPQQHVWRGDTFNLMGGPTPGPQDPLNQALLALGYVNTGR